MIGIKIAQKITKSSWTSPQNSWWLYNSLFARLSLFQKHCKMMATDLSKQQTLALDEQYKKQSKSNTTN